jgi:hypothetical protein
VLVESPIGHRGLPKPLCYADNAGRFKRWADRIVHVVAPNLISSATGLDRAESWANEHRQRDCAWAAVNARAGDKDRVLICDVDEFPSAEALAWDGYGAVSLFMETYLHAVDWRVPDDLIPPTAVMATVGWLRSQGGSLSRIRDNRGVYRKISNGGKHFSWIGGPEAAARKLALSTCHTELIGTEEGRLIASGERWRTGIHGEGHLPVYPVEVDESWPAAIREKRVPAEWFRPRDRASHQEWQQGDPIPSR